MNSKLRLKIYEAIDEIIQNAVESNEDLWDNYIHTSLVAEMTDAAALVFDSAQKAQQYMEEVNR